MLILMLMAIEIEPVSGQKVKDPNENMWRVGSGGDFLRRIKHVNFYGVVCEVRESCPERGSLLAAMDQVQEGLLKRRKLPRLERIDCKWSLLFSHTSDHPRHRE